MGRKNTRLTSGQSTQRNFLLKYSPSNKSSESYTSHSANSGSLSLVAFTFAENRIDCATHSSNPYVVSNLDYQRIIFYLDNLTVDSADCNYCIPLAQGIQAFPFVSFAESAGVLSGKSKKIPNNQRKHLTDSTPVNLVVHPFTSPLVVIFHAGCYLLFVSSTESQKILPKLRKSPIYNRITNIAHEL